MWFKVISFKNIAQTLVGAYFYGWSKVRIYRLVEELLSKNDFEAVLATFCCYDCGAKASEKVHKIATDQEEYRKCSLCVIIC